LRRLTLEGARRRYGNPSPAILAQIADELAIVAEVGYEEYFLLTHDLLWNHCHPVGIEWITRGSAADSLVCFCLGISDVCPVRFELYFKRFLNRDRMALNKLPDIDLDFPHDRKDDVIDLIFKKYGDRAAIVGGFNTFQGRSAFADIAKVMGVSEFQIRRMTEHMPWSGAARIEESVAGSLECRDGTWEEDPYRTALRLARQLDGMPRHPKMHPCGMVLSREPIASLTPLFTANKGWPTTHFDMDAVEAIGLVKMDILAQGGLAAMRDTKSLLAERGIAVDLRALEPWNDPEIWAMISSGGARGVHHIESPAMLGLSKMVGVHTIDDLIAIVSVIRPGASNNLKKESFARRAQGLEPVDYTHPSLAGCLRSTYGVVAYEEHILQICEAFAGLPGGRADVLRRALVKSQQDKIVEVGKEFVEHARALGRTDEEIRAVWTLVSGFQGYAFCRAHSTAYGIEAYQAAHLKRYFPVEFLASVLTNGKGFYGRLVYSIECRRLGIEFLPPDINRSRNGFHPEAGNIRVPLSAIKGLGRRTIDAWSAGKPFSSMRDFYLRCHPGGDDMNSLIRVGAFDGFGDQRTSQFWQFRELAQWGGCTLFPAAGNAALPDVPLREPEAIDNLRAEQELLGFPVSGHPLDMFPGIAWESYCPVSDLGRFCGQRVTVCGLIIEDRIHPQSNGKNMKFLSVCDRSGILECELFASTYNRFGIETIRHPVVEITGTVARNEPGTGHALRVGRIQKPRTTG
jgi:error-prone DNA polymerase